MSPFHHSNGLSTGYIHVLHRRHLLALAFVFTISCFGWAQSHPTAPAFNSRPGASYTLYLNFAGFNYTGNWSTSGQAPGNVPAYNGQTGTTFTATEQANIKNIWARVSEAYAPYSNVNVTTVDPAIAAGQAATDLQRQNYYDATPRVMHTVIGNGASTFFGSAGGVSYVDVWANAASPGRHTNWAFVNRLGGVGAFHNIHTATTHEIGHAAGLSHQGDYIGTTRVNEYSTNNGSSTLAPFIGVGYSATRNTWRVGRISTNVNVIQNDPLAIMTRNPGIGLFNDGIGRTQGTATTLSFLGTGASIDYNLARGIIVPASANNPNPIGANNYTFGYYRFTTTGGLNSITVNAGNQFITPGVADPDATLDATLRLLDINGSQVAVSNTASLSETISMNLAAGTYFIEVSSAGGKAGSLGPAGTWDASSYYDMGSYFLTGFIAVPEPTTIAFMGVSIIGAGLVWYRRRQQQRRTSEAKLNSH
jgi:Bacterial pre-peptidase C-terminal domain/PEP-CTERM motif